MWTWNKLSRSWLMPITMQLELPPTLQPSHHSFISAASKPNTANVASIRWLAWFLHLLPPHQREHRALPRNSLTAICKLQRHHFASEVRLEVSEETEFLQTNLLTLQAMKGKEGRDWWLIQWTTYQPHLRRHNKNSWISTSAPTATGNTQLTSAIPNVCLYISDLLTQWGASHSSSL